MSRVTTLNCDRCGAEISHINTKDHSAKINLWCPGDYRGSGGQRIDLCPECYFKFISFLESEADTKMTNYERIKNMSIEEMAKELLFIFSEDAEIPEYVAEIYYRTGLTMEECWKQWLESEVEQAEEKLKEMRGDNNVSAL